MIEIYDAHEQGEVVKKWLRENGSAIVMGLVIAFGGLFGYKQWQNWQDNTRQRASGEFAVMDQLLTEGQLDAAMANFQTLQEDFPDSPYTSMAALKMARARIEVDQPDLAVGLLEFVMNNGFPKALAVVGRERLARLLLDQGRGEEALQTLAGAQEIGGFEARYAETRGDILHALGRNDEAAAAWQEALAALEAGIGDRELLVMKLQSIGAEVPEDGSES
jgi:predicted negative regulator of RcsB-dependent stress response